MKNYRLQEVTLVNGSKRYHIDVESYKGCADWWPIEVQFFEEQARKRIKELRGVEVKEVKDLE